MTALMTSRRAALGFSLSLLSWVGGTGCYLDSAADSEPPRQAGGLGAQGSMDAPLAPGSASAAIHPGEPFTLAAGNRFELVTNGSGGTIAAATGLYLAGRKGGSVDLVKVIDGSGAEKFLIFRVGAGIRIEPGDTAVAPGGIVRIAASGGSGAGFAFQLTTNASGASLGAQSGVYTAGPRAQTVDELMVTDSLGNTAAIQIVVGDGVVVSPSAPAVSPGGTVVFSASRGGGSRYLFTFESNLSGGALDSSTGVYTAGRIGNVVDEISVVDSLGNWVKIPINVGNGIAIAPSVADLPARGNLQVSARGGSGNGVRFALSANSSGGTIDPETGVYVAGPTTDVSDQVTVTDDVGNSATAVVHLARH
jgi:hypothetical protein